MRKKLLSIIVAAVMVLTLIPAAAFATAPQKATTAPERASVQAPVRVASQVAFWDFETDPVADGWQFIDRDGDGYNWGCVEETGGYTSATHSIMSASYIGGARTPDNWAITPAVELPAGGTATLTYQVKSYSNSYPETYGIFIGTAADPDNMVQVGDDMSSGTTTFAQVEIDLSEYAGETVYIAFVHHNCSDQWKFYIDDVEIIADPEAEPPTPTPEPTPTPAPTPAPDGLIAGYYFEEQVDLNDWFVYDQDGDGNKWGWYNGANVAQYAYEGQGFIGSQSYSGGNALTPDNWAVVGPIQLADEFNEIRFYAAGMGANYCMEHFAVYVGTSSTPASLMENEILAETVATADFVQYTANADVLAGQQVYFGIRHFNCTDMNMLRVDNVEVWSVPKEPIDSVDVSGFTIPEWGAEPGYEYELPEDADYSIESVTWYTSPDGSMNNMTEMEPGELFDDEDVRYGMVVRLVPNSGYYFTEACTGTLDGGFSLLMGPRYAVLDGGEAFELYVGWFTVEREIIDTIELEGFIEPVWGENPSFNVTVPEGANYTIEVQEWYGIEKMTENDVFDNEEAEYYMSFVIIPNEGCKFADMMTVTINGTEELVDYNCVESHPDEAYVDTILFTVEAPQLFYGDANGDGEVTIEDALLMMRYLIDTDTIEDENLDPWCDVNGDGEVNLMDALLVMRKAMGSLDAFPVEM